MFLTSGQVRYLIRTLSPPLIEPTPNQTFCDENGETIDWNRRCSFIEGCLFDLTIEEIKFSDNPNLTPAIGRSTRNIPSLRTLNRESGFVGCGRYVLVSQETINMPAWLRGEIWQRSSFISARCNEPVTRVAPGFSGKIRTGLVVEDGLRLERGARFVGIDFYAYYIPEEYREIYLYEREIDVYGGIWTGDKTDTGGQTERGF